MKPALKTFVTLLDAELSVHGFVRRGPAFRHFAANGNGIVFEIQQSTALFGEVEFYVNVGLLIGPLLAVSLGDKDPRLDARPMYGIWQTRLVGNQTTPDAQRFILSSDDDAQNAFANVQAWMSTSLPKLIGWTDVAEMQAGAYADRERSAWARDEQLRTREYVPGRWPDGHWNYGLLDAYVRAERGDVDGVLAEIADWPGRNEPGSIQMALLAIATGRAAEFTTNPKD